MKREKDSKDATRSDLSDCIIYAKTVTLCVIVRIVRIVSVVGFLVRYYESWYPVLAIVVPI